MAFSKTNFSPIGSNAKRGAAPQHFSYKTTDSLATVDSSGYFNTIATMLSIGDVIHVEVVDSVSATTAVTNFGKLIVASNASGVVDTYDATNGQVVLTAYIADISTAGQIYVVSPVAGKVTAVYSALNGAISGADSVLTVKTAAGTAGTITVAYSGSAAGDVDSLTPSSNNSVAAGATIEIETDGGSTGTIATTITVVVSPIGDTD